jgi:type II secretory pathway pseudopilin PulG
MKRRSGVTLIEVLVAIFVMALGLLTLLALFPLGVLTMSQAIQDDRTASAAANATGVAIAWDVRHDPALTTPIDLFTNPNPAVYLNADPSGPSYPIYVDPMGARSYLGAYVSAVGGQTNGGISRSSVSFVNSTQTALQWFSLLDDIQFDQNGLPKYIDPPNNTTFERDNLYSWAYLLRRPLLNDPSVVELTVVAYNSRSLALSSSLQGDEAAFPNAVFDTGLVSPNMVTLSWAANSAPPNLRVGSWILDATPVADPQGSGKFIPPHAYFYRVVGLTEISNTSIDVELQTPIRGFPPGAQTSGTVIVMDGVAEVFEKGTGRHP